MGTTAGTALFTIKCHETMQKCMNRDNLAASRDVARTLGLGGLRLNLPESTRLISCSIVTDQYLFQCLKAMLFGYLLEVRAGR